MSTTKDISTKIQDIISRYNTSLWKTAYQIGGDHSSNDCYHRLRHYVYYGSTPKFDTLICLFAALATDGYRLNSITMDLLVCKCHCWLKKAVHRNCYYQGEYCPRNGVSKKKVERLFEVSSPRLVTVQYFITMLKLSSSDFRQYLYRSYRYACKIDVNLLPLSKQFFDTFINLMEDFFDFLNIT